MTRQFSDLAAPRFNGQLPRTLDLLPRGLVITPPEIVAHVAKEKARLSAFYTPEFEKMTLDDLTLAYYYEGIDVAYRSVPEGVQVLAVGAEEIGALTRNMSQEELLTISIEQP
jgi:hypothetical protein